MSKLIWAMVALCVLLTGGFIAEQRATEANAALAMPLAEGAQSRSLFIERTSHAFNIIQPTADEFTPSRRTRDLAVRHVVFDGLHPRTWYEHVPEDSGAKMPLVVLLHGAGRDGLSVIEMWQGVAQKYGLALLAPNASGGTWPLDAPRPHLLAKQVSEMATRHRIDPDRVYLFGHSNGAAYAQVLLNRTTGPWRAAVLHAGFAPPSLLRPAQTAKPFRLYIGEHEHIFPIDAARTSGQSLADQGHRNELVFVPGHSHWFYEAGPQIAEDAWGWFDRLGA